LVRVLTRCRVDLAGGTLDIWPLGLLHSGAATINVAVDLRVVVDLAPRQAGWLVEQSGEQVEAARREELLARPETALVGLVASQHALTGAGLTLHSDSPRGAGLGASSALTVALLAAFEVAEAGRLMRTAGARAAVARDLEAQLMSLPTGRQDHFPAQLGGVQLLEHRPGGERARTLDVDLAALGERLVVAHTGQSHFSAGNNWQVVRGRLDGDTRVTVCFDQIRDAAAELLPALERGSWEQVGQAMQREWEARRQLAEGISTPLIERLLAEAQTAGAWGGKVCGAGGGGCIAVLTPPEVRAAVEARLSAAGATLLPATPTATGLEVESA